MINATVKNNISFPSQFIFKKDLEFIANRIFIPSLQLNIEKQRSLDGGRLPKNEPSTKRAKEKKGQGTKTLIASGTLKGDFISMSKGNNTVIITIHPDRKKIGGYLQNDGIRTKRGLKFFNFFGISQKMEKDAIKYMEEKIKRWIDARKSK